MFAVCRSDRTVIYVQMGKPEGIGDALLQEQSTLFLHIQKGQWLGPDIPSLKVGNVQVRPFLLGGCAFRLTPYMMRSCSSKPEKAVDPRLERFVANATSTRKPIECIFGMLKFRFFILKQGFRLAHEDDSAYVATACVISHNMCSAKEGDSEVEAVIDMEIYLRHLDDSISNNTHPRK